MEISDPKGRIGVFAAILLTGMAGALIYAPPVVYHDPILDRGGRLPVFNLDLFSIGDIPTFPPAQTDQNDLTSLAPYASADSVSRPMPFARYFADENGAVYEAVPEVEDPDCVHEFVSGTLVEHTDLPGGKCAETYYKSERYVMCGFTVRSIRVLQTLPGKCGHVFTD